jgi:ribonucleotide monophosphatase NagD (HAD superfamily)
MIGDSIRSDKTGANNAEIDCYIVGKGYSIKNLFDIIRESERLR